MVRLVLEQGYRASNSEQASAAMQAVFGVGTVKVDSVGSLQYSQWSLVDDGISATRIDSHGAAVQMNADPAPDMVVISVGSGHLVLEQGPETLALQAGDLGLVPLEQAVRASWKQVSLELYSFPRASLSHLLSSDTKQLELHVARLKAASPTLVGLWTRTAATLREVLENPEAAESDVIREQAIDALLGLTIEAFGISDANEDDADDQPTLERATTYMRNNLAKAISVTDIAREAGVSLRGLQLAFQRAGRGTPLAHLRALRMTAAQHTLTTATAPAFIADIARQCGYSNIGRLDAHYFDAFGRLPEHDLAPTAGGTAVPNSDSRA